MKIDLVYLWVDGTDPRWLKKKNSLANQTFDDTEANCKGRFIENNELKYSLRSVAKNTPWINRIYIVTDEQAPSWLDTTHSKIKIIDHKDILPDIARPCFNASVIELFIYKIPDLSEHFLYSNDDMFINKKLKPEYFFTKEGYSIVRHKRNYFGKLVDFINMNFGNGPGQYRNMIIDSSKIIEKKFGKYYSGVPHHNIDSYVKSDFKNAVEEVFSDKVEQTAPNKIRTVGDFHRSAILLYYLAINHGTLKYVKRHESLRILPHKHKLNAYLNSYDPDLFCLNDSQKVSDKQRELISPFLEELFPEKSDFEK